MKFIELSTDQPEFQTLHLFEAALRMATRDVSAPFTEFYRTTRRAATIARWCDSTWQGSADRILDEEEWL